MSLQSVPWELLDRYRERYGVDLDAEAATSLERAIGRRKARAHALRRRIEDLEMQLNDASVELKAVEDEIEGSYVTASLLVDELVDRLKEEHDEGWSPSPVLGFRLWAIRDNQVVGYRTRWTRPYLKAVCLNSVRGEDIPHSSGRCGPPACGTYATKDLRTLMDELDLRSIDGYVVGVVALEGKVIEHELGYRAAEARVRALSASLGHRVFNSDDPDLIDQLFGDPEVTIADEGQLAAPTVERASRYLNHWKEKNDQWIWEEKSGS